MIYVVDNNIFSRSFKNLSMDVFDDIWEPWSLYMRTGKIISVDEVNRELGIWVNSTGKDRISLWLKAHKEYFEKPTNDEGYILQEIFKNKKSKHSGCIGCSVYENR